MRVADLEAIRIKLASPEDILQWSHGEVTKPETINYRTQKPEKDGLFDEKIFGPEKDYECYCGKYRGIRHKGIVCDKCGVEVTKAQVRRERMGHIKLATPVSHIWFLRGVPSRIGQVLDLPMIHLEKVIYFNAYIIKSVDETAKKGILEQIEKEFVQKEKVQKAKIKARNPKNQKDEESKGEKREQQDLRLARDKAKDEVNNLKPLRILSEVDYFDLSLKYGQSFEAGTGAETLRKIFSEIDMKKKIVELKEEQETASPLNKRKILKRLKLFQGLVAAGIKPEWMFMTCLPILPPDLRPMVQLDGGRYASSDLNDLYRRVINRNNRLKYLLEISAPEVIVRNEKRMLQEAVDALIDNSMRKGTMTQATTGGRRLLKSLADILKGKQGRFRQNLLGKRVDYSGRSVIVVGPDLKLSQVGLPKKMALELFKPFVIKKILDKELAYNVRGASRLIEQETDEVWAMLEEVVKDKCVLLNRAPTLHRLGIQAFKPILIEGEALRIHPLVCKAFNADFDGDQMAVHLPLSDEAQAEAREIMLSSINLLKPATGLPIVSPSQDIVLGCYWLTKLRSGAKGEGQIFGSAQEALLAYEFDLIDLKATIKVPNPKVPISIRPEFIETSPGRIIFNEALPEDFPFQNQDFNSKKLEELIREVIDKYGIANTQPVLDSIKTLGFEWSGRSGTSWGMDDLVVPKEKPALIEAAEKEIDLIESHFQKGLLSREEKYQRSLEVWHRTKSEIEKLVPKALPANGSVFAIIDSGARGSWSQPVQMAGMKGLVINPVGRIIELPIKHSYKEGLDVLEYFISTHGARKGTADTALRTSTAGYLTRRLVDVSHEMITLDEDCQDEKGMIFSRQDADDIGQTFLLKIIGRVCLENVKILDEAGKEKVILKAGEIIDWEKGKQIVKAALPQVRARSPLSCKLPKGVCRQCYGWSLGNNQLIKLGEAVGVIAAQAIGEPGTQLTMRTFHTGGVAGSDITMGLPRVEEIFEVRLPLGKATISQVEGQVVEIVGNQVVRVSPAEFPDQNKKKKVKAGPAEIIDYPIPEGKELLVKTGDKVKPGQSLCEGNLDLKELFKAVGEEKTQRHIIQEVQRIYSSQGASIHDKHLEVIVRQMFSRLKVREAGGSNFIPGEVISPQRLSEENKKLKKEGKELVTTSPVLLGISKVALATDSFLSAASFIETSRVLIRAAIEGKEDRLQGLKENVIIGKLIPAGTGFKK